MRFFIPPFPSPHPPEMVLGMELKKLTGKLFLINKMENFVNNV